MKTIIFKGRNSSSYYNLNLLQKEGNAYVMDNHLAALWCWLQVIDTESNYNLLHIDRHYDLLDSQTEYWVNSIIDQGINLSEISIEEYSDIKYINADGPLPTYKYPLFRWDNYLTMLYELYPNLIISNIFATHKDGDKPDRFSIDDYESWDLQKELSYWLNNRNENKWIVNLDIDYFFTDDDDNYFQLFTDEYIIKIADELKQSIHRIEVLTIALSPEMCGGWEIAERVVSLITNHLGMDFKIA